MTLTDFKLENYKESLNYRGKNDLLINWINTIIIIFTFSVFFNIYKLNINYSKLLFIIPNISSILSYIFNIISNYFGCERALECSNYTGDDLNEIKIIKAKYILPIQWSTNLCYIFNIIGIISITILSYINF